MSLRILLTDIYWFNVNGVLDGPGYVYLNNGILEMMGPGEPPEEAQYAEYLAGGNGRVVVPGFVLGPIIPETYILRDFIDVNETIDIVMGVSRLSRHIVNMNSKEAYYASLMMFYEAALNGYTSVIAITPNVSAVARALEDSGLYGLVLAPIGCGYYDAKTVASEYTGLQNVKTGRIYCRDKPSGRDFELTSEGIIYVNGEPLYKLPPWNNDITPSPGTALAASPWPLFSGLYGLDPLKAYNHLILTGYKPLDSSYKPYKGLANLVVVDTTEPPSWFIPMRGLTVKYLSPTRPRIEMVVSMGRLVVDSGEHMYIGSSKTREAQEYLSKILEGLLREREGGQ